MSFLSNLAFVIFVVASLLLIFSLWIQLVREQAKRDVETRKLLELLKSLLEEQNEREEGDEPT